MYGQLEEGLRTLAEPLDDLWHPGDLSSQRLQFGIVVDLRVGAYHGQFVTHAEESYVGVTQLMQYTQASLNSSPINRISLQHCNTFLLPTPAVADEWVWHP